MLHCINEGSSSGRCRYPKQNTAAWGQTASRAAIAFCLEGNKFFFLLHSSRRLPWVYKTMPAKLAVSAGSVGEEEKIRQHREPAGVPSSAPKPRIERERLTVVNIRFPSLSPFRCSI